MAYTYKPSGISAKQKMGFGSWCLEITSSINNIINVFATVFLVSHIISINADAPIANSLVSISIYYIALHVLFAITYFLCGYIVDKSNRVWVYRIGCLLKCVFIISVIFLGEELAQLSVLAGAIYGIAEGTYYSSYNVMKSEVIPRAHADKYVAINSILHKITNIVFPILIGFLIDKSTYIVVSFYVLILVAIQIVFTFFIKSKRPNNSSFSPFKYLKALKGNSEDVKRIKRVYVVSICYGFTSIVSPILTFLNIYTFKTNVNLGLFTALFAVVSIIALILIKRFTKPGKRQIPYIIFSVLSVAVSVLVAVYISKWTYILYNLILTPVTAMVGYASDVQRTVIVKKTGHYDDIAEHQTVVESLCYSSARLISFIALLVLGLTLGLTGFKILLAIDVLCIPTLCYFLHKMEKVESNYPLELRVALEESEVVKTENSEVK